jgi:hypothetical protein
MAGRRPSSRRRGPDPSGVRHHDSVLTPDQEARLDSLAREFLSVLRSRIDPRHYRAEFTDRPERLKVTFPARHPETGDLVVRVGGDDVTVSIGLGFHTHFPTFMEELPVDNWERAAAEEAIDYIEEFLADRIVLRLHFKNGEIRSGGTFSVDHPAKPLARGEKEYLWSGPRPARASR